MDALMPSAASDHETPSEGIQDARSTNCRPPAAIP